MERPEQGLNVLVNENESKQILFVIFLFTNEKADDYGRWQIEAEYCHTGLVRTVPGRHHYCGCFDDKSDYFSLGDVYMIRVITSHWGMF